MNLVSARLETDGSGLSVRLSDTLTFPVPESRAAHSSAYTGKEVVFGLRPEHITETRGGENGSGRVLNNPRRGRADGHGHDGVFHDRWDRSLRPRRTLCRERVK